MILSAMASQITSISIVYSTVCSGADERKQSSASLAFVSGIYRWPVISPHKGPVKRKMFPFDDVMIIRSQYWFNHTNCPSVCLSFNSSATEKQPLHKQLRNKILMDAAPINIYLKYKGSPFITLWYMHNLLHNNLGSKLWKCQEIL